MHSAMGEGIEIEPVCGCYCVVCYPPPPLNVKPPANPLISPSNSIPQLLTSADVKADRISAGMRFAFPEANEHQHTRWWFVTCI